MLNIKLQIQGMC